MNLRSYSLSSLELVAGEGEKGSSGMSLEMETKMIDMFKALKISDNPLLTDRLLKLAVELKTLNES